MYYSPICFLIPILLLDLPFYHLFSLFCLTLASFLYHNYPNKITNRFDNANIINTCSIMYFNNFNTSLYYLFLYFIEKRYSKTHYIMYFIYFLSYTKFMKSPIINLYFFSSLFIFGITFFQEKNQFDFYPYQRWLWHFGQAMYVYHSLSENYIHRLEL
jgi:hypothetical protein